MPHHIPPKLNVSNAIKKGAVGIDQAALDADPAVFSQPAEQRQ